MYMKGITNVWALFNDPAMLPEPKEKIIIRSAKKNGVIPQSKYFFGLPALLFIITYKNDPKKKMDLKTFATPVNEPPVAFAKP